MKRTGYPLLLVAAACILAFASPVSAGGGCNGNLPASTLSSSIDSVQDTWQDYQSTLGIKGSSLTSRFAKPGFKQIGDKTSAKAKYRPLT